MKLTIIVTGLVLLAPDRGNDRLHLFFPQVDMSHPKMSLHSPFLRYTAEAGAQSVPLRGWTLDLGTLSPPGSAAVPAEALNLYHEYSWEVPRSWVTGTPHRRVQGRLSLPWPDAISSSGTAHWLLVRGVRFKEVTLTNEVTLTYETPNSPPARWTLISLPSRPGGTVSIPAYHPGGSGDIIRISNLPAHETDLTLWDEGVHFQGYVDILRRGFFDQLLARPRVFLNEAPGLSPFNCMLASADVRP